MYTVKRAIKTNLNWLKMFLWKPAQKKYHAFVNLNYKKQNKSYNYDIKWNIKMETFYVIIMAKYLMTVVCSNYDSVTISPFIKR